MRDALCRPLLQNFSSGCGVSQICVASPLGSPACRASPGRGGLWGLVGGGLGRGGGGWVRIWLFWGVADGVGSPMVVSHTVLLLV